MSLKESSNPCWQLLSLPPGWQKDWKVMKNSQLALKTFGKASKGSEVEMVEAAIGPLPLKLACRLHHGSWHERRMKIYSDNKRVHPVLCVRHFWSEGPDHKVSGGFASKGPDYEVSILVNCSNTVTFCTLIKICKNSITNACFTLSPCG